MKNRDDKQTLSISRSDIQLLQTDGDELRRFRMLAYTGAEVMRMFGRAIFDISGIEHEDKVPMLVDHREDKRAGFADKIEMGDSIALEGFISRATAAGQEVEALSDEGFPWQASMQIIVFSWEELEPGAKATVNGRDVIGPISIARTGRMIESSWLFAGADKDTFAVALAATLEEQMMDATAFAAAHPEAVKAWQDQAAEMAKTEERTALAVFLGMFPGREAWAALKYSEGLSAVETKAALSDVLMEELAVARAAPAPAQPAPAAPTPDQTIIAKLTQQAQPGVSFDGQAQQGGDDAAQAEALMASLPLEQRCQVEWLSDAKLRAEFANKLSAYIAFSRREAEGTAA